MSSSAALSSLLTLVDGPSTSAVAYVIGGTTLTGEPREVAAGLIADDAMTIACGKSPVLDYWRARRDGGPPEAGSRLEAVKTFVRIGFGLPDRPLNDDHLQGHIAELLWNRLVQERLVCRDGRQLVRAHSVKIDPLEPGGDGLVVYEDTENTLVFRLWEIKKHDAKRGVAATINKACKQLASRGHEYLAKLAGPETMGDDGALTDLYANMVELWFDRSERAGVGVSIGTSADRAPTQPRAFRSIGTAFPTFTAASQRECIVVAVPDFPAFAERVKEIVWSGL
jgi:hypothetical protein